MYWTSIYFILREIKYIIVRTFGPWEKFIIKIKIYKIFLIKYPVCCKKIVK